MKIILSRHGNTFSASDPVVWVGATQDLPLVDSGILQAKCLAQTLQKAKIHPKAVYCGPLKRTRDYAAIVLEQLHSSVKPIIDARLNEIDYGNWAGLSNTQIQEIDEGDELAAWENLSVWPKIARWSGSPTQMIKEVKMFSKALVAQYEPTDTIVVITSNADTLQRYNIEVDENINLKQALNESTKRGSEWVSKYKPLFSNLKKSDIDYEFVHWQTVKEDKDFELYFEKIKKLDKEDSFFQEALAISSNEYTMRPSRIISEATYQKAEENSRLFLIEECAVFQVLAKDKDNLAIVYPGAVTNILAYAIKHINENHRDKKNPFYWLDLKPHKNNKKRKRTESQVKEVSKAPFLRTPGHIYWKDIEGVYQGSNDAQAIFLGYKTGKDLIGKTDFDLPWKEQAIHLQQIDNQVMKTQKEYCVEEIVSSQKKVKTTFLSRKIPLYDLNTNKVIGIIGTSIDITESKQAEVAKQQFIMNMAHDLRTPLSGIIGLSNIQSKEGTNAVDRQHGQWIECAGEQLLKLLNSVLEVTVAEYQIESIAKDTILLQQFAEELQALMLPAIVAKELDFKVKLDAHLPLIITDRIKLKRLVLNLLANAVKFTKKGRVGLEINLLTVEENQAKIEIIISDTGIGIAEDKLGKIFDRFYRAHPSYETQYTGYGIGLFLVKKTIELLGGQIKVSSEEGKGSCFTATFSFLLAEEKIMPSLSQQLKSKSEADEQTKSVLVAEDNSLVSHVVKNLLVSLGYEVTAVTDGKAALNSLQTQCFHWGLLDIGLPGLAGTEVVKAYRQWGKDHNKPRIPLFALTAHAIDEIKEKCEAVGFDCILNKPFTIKDIQIIKLFMENKN
ncbi:hypothetical protein FQR65_LT05273 [Abscondita terminalis]|nr:hypothetical protein FQR65_LT05273 [Abscondita terminalis]